MAMIIDIKVKTSATMPILFDLESDCFKYFHTYHRPNGGKKKLTKYMVACFPIVKDNGLSFNGLPQLEQKYAEGIFKKWQDSQITSDWFSIFYKIFIRYYSR